MAKRRLYPLLRLVGGFLLGLFAIAITAKAAQAETITVTHWGGQFYGVPYAVAMEKGFFKAEGADIGGVLSSAGGGTTVRNLLTGHLAYGEIDLAGTVAAIQQGANLKIISDNVLTVAEFVWAVKPDSPIKAIQDLKGKKIGYTNPRSTSQALNALLLQTIGLTQTDVTPTKVGGFGEQVVALDIGAIDVATLADPVWSKNKAQFRVLV